ncbi:MAG: hypothetical protein NW207_07455, partial [Cytophagales bacterium]|nr:hypothetical protein [Cytophagales bacterium]
GIISPSYKMHVVESNGIPNYAPAWITFTSSATSGGNTGINIDVTGNAASGTAVIYGAYAKATAANFANYATGVYGEAAYTGGTTSALTGVWGEAKSIHTGENYGVYGRAYASSTANYGVAGIVSGTGGTNNYGVYANVNASGTNSYGLYVSVTGAATNKAAAVFNGGTVAIGYINPPIPTASLQINAVSDGIVVRDGINNDGIIIDKDWVRSGWTGTNLNIGAGNNLIFQTNNAGWQQRMIIDNAGKFGLGRNTTTGALVTLGQAGIEGSINMFGATSGSVTLTPPATVITPYTFTLPDSDSPSQSVLYNNGSGFTKWQQMGVVSNIIANVGPINNVETKIISYQIPPNSAAIGTTYRIKIFGNATSTAANTSTFRIRYGTTDTNSDAVVITSAPTAATTGTDVAFMLEALVVFRTIGGSGTLMPSIVINNANNTGVMNSPTFSTQPLTAVTINTTATNYLRLSYQASAATTNVTIRNAIIELIRP